MRVILLLIAILHDLYDFHALLTLLLDIVLMYQENQIHWVILFFSYVKIYLLEYLPKIKNLIFILN